MLDIKYASLNNKEKIKLIAKQYGTSYHRYASNTSTYSDIYFINVLNKAFDQLDDKGKMYINNIYFLQQNAKWWKNIYPKSTYYRLKNKYLNQFIKNVEEIYDTYC